MHYKISDVIVSIDHLAMRTDTRTSLLFDPRIINSHVLLRGIPLKVNQSPHYAFAYDYIHKVSRNKVTILAHMRGKDHFVPNLLVKFFSSWDKRLSYREVVELFNDLTREYNIEFQVSRFHLALDIFNPLPGYYFHALASCVKSGRKIHPQQDHPTTYRWHSRDSLFCLESYDKRAQLLATHKELSPRSQRTLHTSHITRFELKFNHLFLGSDMPSLLALATMDFSSVYPCCLQFLQPDPVFLKGFGAAAKRYQDLSLVKLRRLLSRKHDLTSNFFYYLQDNPRLSAPVVKALRAYRWCRNPHRFPLAKPKVALKSPAVRFIKL